MIPPNNKSWRGTKEPLDECERGEWKACLKVNIQKNYVNGIQSQHFMASRWGNTSRWKHRLYFFLGGGLQNHCRQWLQPWNWKIFGPLKESNEKPRQHIKNHHFANKGPYSHIMVFPVVMHGCKSRTIKKADELMFSNCGAGEDPWGSLGLHGT